MDIDFIIKIASFISALAIIFTSIKKIIDKTLSPLNEKIKELDISVCTNFLIDYLYDVETNKEKENFKTKRAYEVYDHYINDLKQNSYIKDKWEQVMEVKCEHRN